MNKHSILLYFVLVTLTFFNCERNTPEYFPADPNGNMNDDLFQSQNFGNPTTGNFIGLIKDEAGSRLENAQISVGSTTTYTDRNGMFVINNADVFENFAYIRAFKPGYIEGSRVVIPKTDGENRIDIVLYKNEPNSTINSGEISNVYFSGGGNISFPGDFTDDNGNPYSGQVEVVVDYVRPNSLTTFTNMPGSLFAQTFSNNAVSLETYGMVSVNLFSPSGEPLNIDEDSPATIEFPINSSQLDIAPDTIKLWYFDDTVGYWKEDGEAIRVDNKYVGTVSHFTWWNCDVPMDFVNLCFSISSMNTDAETPYYVVIERNSNSQILYTGIAQSSDGLECGLIPQDEDLTVYIYSASEYCNLQLVHEEVIGPFASDSDINIFFSEELEVSTTTITGALMNCNGTPLTNGYVYIDDNNAFSINDGLLNIAIEHCSNSTVNIQIFDFDTNLWNIIYDVNLTGDPLDIGAISTCENSGGIYNGNITLLTQEEVDTFGLFGYVLIDGNISIGDYNYNDPDTPNEIFDLSALSTIENVSGELLIFNTQLQNLTGLNNLSSTKDLRISSNTQLSSLTSLNNLENIQQLLNITYNNNLTSLEGLEGISNIGTVSISNNAQLTSLEGLNSLTSVYRLLISSNSNMTSLSAISNLNDVEIIQIYSMPALNSLDGITQITNLGFLRLSYLDGLTDLSELSNLTSVDLLNIAGNDALESLNGLDNLLNSQGILIGQDIDFDIINNAPNPNLTDYCALENLFINGSYIEFPTNPDLPFDGVTIVNNAYNPSVQDIINGDCSQ